MVILYKQFIIRHLEIAFKDTQNRCYIKEITMVYSAQAVLKLDTTKKLTKGHFTSAVNRLVRHTTQSGRVVIHANFLPAANINSAKGNSTPALFNLNAPY